MRDTPITNKSTAGFTLIELSIVLVIIGLIVGGVLVGQDLIKAAELRAGVGQIEKYDAAANTFRTKYNGLPGDFSSASTFGFTITGYTPDGDNLIEANADTNGTEYDYEAAAFFYQLGVANLISEPIVATGGGGSVSFATAEVDTIGNYAPQSKLGRGAYVLVRQNSGLNYYMLAVPSAANGVLTITDGSQIAVIDAFNMDGKLDDGYPTSGRVQAYTDFDTADAGAAAAADICVNTTPTPDAYNTGTTAYQTDRECALRMRTSF